jgi:hypothetical protein
MVSRFELKRLQDVPRFLLDSVRIRRQVLRANGALGVSLIAHPLRRQFLTLSAWGDRQAVNGLVRTETSPLGDAAAPPRDGGGHGYLQGSPPR